MATNPSTLPENSGRITAPDADYPYGSAKDDTTGTTGDGTPIKKALLNDTYGFYQWLLSEAGIVPSGNAETVNASQLGESLQKVAGVLFGLGATDLPTISNFDTIVETGLYEATAGASNAPAGWGGGVVINQIRDTGDRGLQIAVQVNNNDIFVRVRNGGVWAGWLIIPTAAIGANLWTDSNNIISTVTNGYIQFANGLILQWFVGQAGANDVGFTNNFPIAFPTASLNAVAVNGGTGATRRSVSPHRRCLRTRAWTRTVTSRCRRSVKGSSPSRQPRAASRRASVATRRSKARIWSSSRSGFEPYWLTIASIRWVARR